MPSFTYRLLPLLLGLAVLGQAQSLPDSSARVVPPGAVQATPPSLPAAVRADSSGPSSSDGWQAFSLDLSLDGWRPAADGSPTASTSLGLSRPWSARWLTATPSLQLEGAYDTAFHPSSATFEAALRSAPLPWLALGASAWWTTWEGPDDLGGTLSLGLSGSLPTGTRAGLSASGSADRLGSPTPSVALGLGQRLGPLDLSLGGGWSWDAVTYTSTRIRTNARGLPDTVEADTTKRAHLWSATARLTWKGEDWDFGPVLGFTQQTVPLGSETLVQRTAGTIKGGKAVSPASSSSSSATARNRTWKLGWDVDWTPTEDLLLSLSVSNTWASQKVNVKEGTQRGKVAVTASGVDHRAALLGRALPPAEGLAASLSASLDF